MNSFICLNKEFSTTQCLITYKPIIKSNVMDKVNSVLFLSEKRDRKGKGGLRTKGYFKRSYENKPLMSIVTVVFNGEKYLEETIRSVINQTYDNVEYIIIDGGSTDDTIGIIKKYENKIDYWVSEGDEGMYDALAKGFSLCSGQIMAYINADDFYLPNAFSTVIDIFKKYEDIMWLASVPVSYNEFGQIIGVDYLWGYHQNNIMQGLHCGGNKLGFIQQESTFWRSRLLDNVDMKSLRQFRFAGDYYLWKQFAKFEKLYLVQSCLSGFRSHGSQLSNNMEKYMEEFNKIKDRTTITWRLRVVLLKILTLFPRRVKRKYGQNIIYFHWKKETWVKNNR